MFALQLEEKKLNIRIEIDEHVPAELEGDEERIMQILQNLMSNAIRFTETGEIIIKFTQDGGSLQISVQDTGIGMS